MVTISQVGREGAQRGVLIKGVIQGAPIHPRFALCMREAGLSQQPAVDVHTKHADKVGLTSQVI